MKGRIYENRTRLCLLTLLVSFLINSHLVIAEPEPASPGMIYADNFIEDPEELVIFISALKYNLVSLIFYTIDNFIENKFQLND